MELKVFPNTCNFRVNADKQHGRSDSPIERRIETSIRGRGLYAALPRIAAYSTCSRVAVLAEENFLRPSHPGVVRLAHCSLGCRPPRRRGGLLVKNGSEG